MSLRPEKDRLSVPILIISRLQQLRSCLFEQPIIKIKLAPSSIITVE
ncbi:hypothetical protein HanHA300_Chr11g0416561 [Helianthus annuus]|nr:hypothetical protein HanHA300_Chr11g0416561 [Helianthus annuus]